MRTSTLVIFALSISGLLLGAALAIPVDVFRFARDAAGKQILLPNGHPKLETDIWGSLIFNWPANVTWLISLFLLVWLYARMHRHLSQSRSVAEVKLGNND